MRISMHKASAYLFGCMCGFILACQPEKDQSIKEQSIEGRWELERASVNGEGTDRLRNLYFVFLPDTSLQTNIMGSEQNFAYRFLEDNIIQQSSDPQFSYRINEMTDSTMVMETEIRQNLFTIFLSKVKPKVHTAPVN
ncbi:MAG: hypothetical protein HKN87_03645 [Saprospiraceae bacterium]|nr:hypothetical protein [Saprospiraceae bacterium]